MKWLLDWLDDRTGYREIASDALYEKIPGGAKWRYVWGSTLVFAFVTQMITGIFLWMSYSPSSRTAWESVYYIQYEMQGGWLLRGIHHYMAQVMVVLLVIHLLQVVIDGAYRAPREINFWMGLVLMKIVFALGLTGYLLPWDQKGYWATAVATNLAGIVPYIGPSIQKVVVGGSEYGNHTLTRFFALHAGVLPGLLMAFLGLHIFLFRKHGIKTHDESAPASYFWPDQVLKDGVACLAVMAVVLLLCTKGFFTSHASLDRDEVADGTGEATHLEAGDYLGAHLTPPADPSESYAAARPEWYFLFLFEGLKYFNKETMGPTFGNEFFGAIVAPGLIMGFLFAMPIIGKWKLGHGFNVAMLIALIFGASLLTLRALQTDYYVRLHGEDLAENASEEDKELHAKRIQDSINYLAAKKEASTQAFRLRQLIKHRGGIPIEGAITLMEQDSELAGPKLFTQHCASCHAHTDELGHGIAGPTSGPGAPNLYGFASREWLTGLLDPEKYVSAEYFGNTKHKENDMHTYLSGHVAYLTEDGKAELKKVVAALSAEAGLVSQAKLDADDEQSGLLTEGRGLLATSLSSNDDAEEDYSCTDCHSFRNNQDGSEINLTGYGSEEWLVNLIANVDHDRFYGGDNDRMPIFHDESKEENTLTLEQIRLIARWLRGDDKYLSPPEGAESSEATEPSDESDSEEDTATDEESNTTD